MDCDYALHVMPQMTQLHQDVDHVKTKVKQQDQDLKVSSSLVSMCGGYVYAGVNRNVVRTLSRGRWPSIASTENTHSSSYDEMISPMKESEYKVVMVCLWC